MVQQSHFWVYILNTGSIFFFLKFLNFYTQRASIVSALGRCAE